MTGPGFRVRTVAVLPGQERPYDEAEWHGALVLVERGEVELEGLGGSRRRFAAGDLLSLSGLALRRVRNRGPERAVLVAVSRVPDPTR